jgi:hypothetical protein
MKACARLLFAVLALSSQGALSQAPSISCREASIFTSAVTILRNAGYPLARAGSQIDADPEFNANEKEVLKEMAGVIYNAPSLTPSVLARLADIACREASRGQPSPPKLGRLFFTPEQREALDARRKAGTPDTSTVLQESSLRLDGYVKRSGGKSTVWVNGAPVQEGDPVTARVNPDGQGRISIAVPEGPTAGLKPGETFAVHDNKTSDVVPADAISIRRRAR